MIKKILIANRGEIACRIIKTAHRLNIKTVAVYSEADREALHVTMADEAVPIGPAPSDQSYLVIDNIIRAIGDTNADAVHPGYGFLSENADFVRKLKDTGIIFIGPDPDAIKAMGDKIESKKLAEKAKVNCIPGHLSAIRDVKEAVKVAREIGYPVMLKASAGGGGKGMRIARNDEECETGLARTQSEALSSFGDDRVFIEKLIEQPRHIEIQILADGKEAVYLGERECSIQRRHQKVLEEAPSSFLDEATRQAMGEQAVSLAKAVGYKSAGTVEFIVDGKRNFYFLEMNTRLQVEHPVTEFVTGIDLVEEMIRIAEGDPLRIRQSDVKLTGWSLEARLYAEDPTRGFLPSIGRLVRFSPPVADETVRLDTGVTEGSRISMYYDPMIAKLITYGDDRAQAINKMADALNQMVIRGISHNTGFLSALVAHKRFRKGDISTDFIAEEYPEGFDPLGGKHLKDSDVTKILVVATVVHGRYMRRAAQISGQVEGHKRVVDRDWIVFTNDEQEIPVTLDMIPTTGMETVSVNGRDYEVLSSWLFGEPRFTGTINGEQVCIQIKRQGVRYRIDYSGGQFNLLILPQRIASFWSFMPHREDENKSSQVRSPMPGLLLSVAVEVGQTVKAGEELAVIEAMKMENILRAEHDGTVAKIHVDAGANLSVDQVLISFE